MKGLSTEVGFEIMPEALMPDKNKSISLKEKRTKRNLGALLPFIKLLID